MDRSATNWGWLIRATLAMCAIFSASLFAPLFAQSISGHIAAVVDDDGRRFFINAEPAAKANLTTRSRAPTSTCPRNLLSQDTAGRPWTWAATALKNSFAKQRTATAWIRRWSARDRNGIELESKAWSHKGAGGLMQLIPTTAHRYGASDVFNPQQNIDAGVNISSGCWNDTMATSTWPWRRNNAGEGAVDRAHGIPAFERRGVMCRKCRTLLPAGLRTSC